MTTTETWTAFDRALVAADTEVVTTDNALNEAAKAALCQQEREHHDQNTEV